MGKSVIWSKKNAKQKSRIMEQNKEARRKRAVKIRELFGGKCAICGYSRCFPALEFHHVVKSTKKFCLSVLHMSKTWGKIVAEAKKCVLLCANCHREVGSGIITTKEIKDLYSKVMDVGN